MISKNKDILAALQDGSTNLLTDLKSMIESTKAQVASYANSSLVMLYWKIGQRINLDILKKERALYGEKIIKHLSDQLTLNYGNGFNARSLFRMIKFAKIYDDEKIVATLSSLFSWSKFIELIIIEDPLKRQFYTELCYMENWSVRLLRQKISGLLYERTAISHKPEQFISQELKSLKQTKHLSKDMVFRDPYILDFLDLPANFSEATLEKAILDDLSKFLTELGSDFCFIARQKRITIDNEDYYIDLLMYHRSLRRLIAIDLKLDTFKASYKGQMELYLRWLNKYERKTTEEEPMGLILCGGKNKEHIELLELDKSGIHVAQYLTELPPKDILEARLHSVIKLARQNHKD
jgi:predicted nuclease of restriction endonuclease-like (RecB) superfamily